MAELDRINLALAVDTNQWASGLRGASTMLAGFGTNVDSAITKITSKLGKASNLFGAFGIGVGLALGASIGPAIAFETAFTGVLETVSGTPAELAKVRAGILDLAGSMPAAAGEIASVAEAAGQLGVSTGGVVKFAETMIMLGETTNLSAEEAATSLAQFSNIMGTSEADIGRLGATIVGLGNNAATTEADIVSWGMRLAGAGKVAGMTEAEVLGIGTALASVGIAAEAGGTAISTVLFDITKAVESGSPKLETFGEVAGMTGEAFATMFQDDPTAALIAFVEGLARVEAEGGSAVVMLDELGLDGDRLSRVLLSAAGAGDLLADSVAQAGDEFGSGGALIDEYGKFADTTASKLKVMAGQLEVLAIQAGTPMLDGIVAGAEAATEGIQFLSEAFGPAASEIAEFVGAMIDAGASIAAVFGGPALAIVAAGLVGLASATGTLFDILNQIPGAAAAATIGIGLFLIATKTSALASAGTAIAALAINLAVIGPTATLAAGGMALLQAAISAGPLILAVGALAMIGKSLIDAKKHAEEAATAFDDRLNKALETGSLEEYSAAVVDLTDRMAELKEIDTVDEGFGGGWASWGTALKSVGQILTPFTENTVVNARAELEALEEVADRQGPAFDRISPALGTMATNLGLTTEETYKYAQEAGVLDVVLGNQISGFAAAEAAVAELAIEHDQAAASFTGTSAAFEAFREKMDAGLGTFGDVAESLDLTATSLSFLMTEAGVTESDLLDADKWEGARSAVDGVRQAYDELAAQIGQTGAEMTDTLGAILNTGAAWDDLASRVAGYQSALDSLNAADVGFAAATAELEAQKTAFDGSTGAAETYAGAIRTAVLAYAATGASTAEVIAYQDQLAASFIETAIAADMPIGVVQELLATLGLVPPEVIVDIVAEAEKVQAEADAIIAKLNELTESEFVAVISAETGVATLDVQTAYAILEDWDQTVAVAQLSADTGVAIEDLATLVALGVDWETTVAVATFQANGDDAATVLQKLVADGATWDTLVAVATLLAQDDASVTVEDLLGNLEGVEGERIAELLAQVSGLDDVEALKAAIDALRDKTVSVTVNSGTFTAPRSTYTPTPGGSGSYSADGNLYFAAGGLLGPIAERSGTAKLYSPTPRNRIHSEPETGGEAYIPLAHHKRGRSVPLWRETGRRLGQRFADGGITGSFAGGALLGSGSFLDPVGIPINVDVTVNGRGIGEVNTSLTGLSSSLNSVGKSAAALTPAFQNSFGSVQDIANRTGQSFEAVEAAAIKSFGTIEQKSMSARIAALDVPAAFLQSFGPIEELMARTGVSIEELEATFGTTAGAAESSAERMFNAFERAGLGIAEVARDAGRALLEDMDPSVFLATMERISGWAASDLGQVLDGFEGSVADTIDWIEDAGLTMEDVFRTVFLEAADDIDVMVGALGILEGQMADTADASRLLDDALNFLTGQQRNLLEAQLDGVQAVERFTDAMDKEGSTLDKTTAAGARNYEQLLKTGDALRDVVVATAESGAGMEATQGAYDNAVTTFRNLASNAGLGADEIEALVAMLFTMPETIVSEVVVNGIEQREGVEAMLDALETMGGIVANPAIVLEDNAAGVELAGILDDLETLGVTETIITVDPDTGQATIDLGLVHEVMKKIDEERAQAGVDADTADADEKLNLLTLLLTGFTSDEWRALVAATDNATPIIQLPATVAQTYAAGVYNPAVEATDTTATSTFAGATQKGDTYAVKGYDAKATATDTTASATFSAAAGVGNAFAIATYDGKATATDVDATQKFNSAATAGRAFAITYTATLKAIDNASGIINGVAGAARSAAGTYTVAINTVRTETVRRVTEAIAATGRGAAAGGSSGGGQQYIADGAILFGGHQYMAAGGIPDRAARIAPAGSWITWAEDETGGESYIPWAMDRRPRATDILNQTARGFGYGLHPLSQNGGGYGPTGPTIVVSPGAVNVDISTPAGTDPREFARIADQAVERGFRDFAREITLATATR